MEPGPRGEPQAGKVDPSISRPKKIWERSAVWREESLQKVKRLEEALLAGDMKECTFEPAILPHNPHKPLRRTSLAASLRDPTTIVTAAPPTTPPAVPAIPLALRSSRLGWADRPIDALAEPRLAAALSDRGGAPPPPPGAPPAHALRAPRSAASPPAPPLASTPPLQKQQQQQRRQGSKAQVPPRAGLPDHLQGLKLQLTRAEEQIQALLKERSAHLASLHELRSGAGVFDQAEVFRELSKQNIMLNEERNALLVAKQSACRDLVAACEGFEAERECLLEEARTAQALVMVAEEQTSSYGAATAGARREMASLREELARVAAERDRARAEREELALAHEREVEALMLAHEREA